MDNLCALLQEAGLTYDRDEDGDITIEIEFEDGRSQLTVIANKTCDLFGTPCYLVYSTACEDAFILPGKTLENCLRSNAKKKVGAWMLHEDSLIYGAKITANAPAAVLKGCIEYIAAQADAFEQANMTGDDL